MTNFEFYKGAHEALRRAFKVFCERHDIECTGCPFKTDNNDDDRQDCMARFICAEHEEPPKKKRRPYTPNEADGLIGKKLVFKTSGVKHNELITSTIEGRIDFYINGYTQDMLFESGATIDGEPFGVEVTE